ncbi:MAG TPA: dihydropyrimidinase, partial [Burkholderiaceae bacterium]|nr:dihydropyrimidinase [Burkholderiaceae bacterium]
MSEASAFDLIIQGGLIVTDTDTVQADVGIRDGLIAQIARGLPEAASARRVIDGDGKLVLPGGVDSH